jgi:RNA polymerase sigma-70 factor (ECF subfamily)
LLEQDTDSDEALVRRAGAGDRAAASLLVERHTRMIYAACYRMLGSKAAAEDAAQETFLRLWRSASRWKPQGAKFETWLYRVAMNICIDDLRKRKREAPEDAAPERADTAARQDQALFLRERRFAVDEALSRLPERQKLAITLCHYQELTNIEAAEIMGLSVDALESLLARGRRALRDMLSPMREHLTGKMDDEQSAHHIN